MLRGTTVSVRPTTELHAGQRLVIRLDRARVEPEFDARRNARQFASPPKAATSNELVATETAPDSGVFYGAIATDSNVHRRSSRTIAA